MGTLLATHDVQSVQCGLQGMGGILLLLILSQPKPATVHTNPKPKGQTQSSNLRRPELPTPDIERVDHFCESKLLKIVNSLQSSSSHLDGLIWFAVKERKLSYHNRCICICIYIN